MLITRTKKDEVSELTFRWRLDILLTELLRTKNYNVYTLNELLEIQNTLGVMSIKTMGAYIKSLNPRGRSGGVTEYEISFFNKLKSITINRFEIMLLIKYRNEDCIPKSLMEDTLYALNYKVASINDMHKVSILYYKVISQMLPNQIDEFTNYLKDLTIAPLPKTLSNQVYRCLTLYSNHGIISSEDVIQALLLQRQYSLWFSNTGELTVNINIDANNLIKLITYVPVTISGFNTLLRNLSNIKETIGKE